MTLEQRIRLRLHAAYVAATPERRAELVRQLAFIRWWNDAAFAAADRDPRRRGYGRSKGAEDLLRRRKIADP